MRNSKGFTLIEVMIVVAIIAILVALAVPAYNGYVERARRADGKSALLNLHLEQGKWRASHTTYTGTVADVSSGTSPDGHYTIAITANSATAFTATATPQGAQSGDSCGTFTITQAGPDVSTAAKEKCWDR